MIFDILLLTAIVVYLGLLGAGTYIGYRWAKRRNFSTGRVWAAALVGFLIVFVPVFWDAVPTLVAYEWYCRTDAGFHNYKTIDQWKKENPGVAETLQSSERLESESFRVSEGVIRYDINSRFRSETKSDLRAWGIKTRDLRLVDSKTGEVIARFLDFNTDISDSLAHGIRSLRDIKFWMNRNRCVEDREASGLNQFVAIVNQVKAMGGAR